MKLFYNKKDLARILTRKEGKEITAASISKTIPCKKGTSCHVDGDFRYISNDEIYAEVGGEVYEVWHRQKTDDNTVDKQGVRTSIFFDDNPPKSLAEYIKVAEVKGRGDNHTSRLGEVYQRTNHINTIWMQNPGVDAYSDNCRSTSVNDILIHKTTQTQFRVAGIGFEKIELT